MQCFCAELSSQCQRRDFWDHAAWSQKLRSGSAKWCKTFKLWLRKGIQIKYTNTVEDFFFVVAIFLIKIFICLFLIWLFIFFLIHYISITVLPPFQSLPHTSHLSSRSPPPSPPNSPEEQASQGCEHGISSNNRTRHKPPYQDITTQFEEKGPKNWQKSQR